MSRPNLAAIPFLFLLGSSEDHARGIRWNIRRFMEAEYLVRRCWVQRSEHVSVDWNEDERYWANFDMTPGLTEAQRLPVVVAFLRGAYSLEDSRYEGELEVEG